MLALVLVLELPFHTHIRHELFLPFKKPDVGADDGERPTNTYF